jgi:hypothetical protein
MQQKPTKWHIETPVNNKCITLHTVASCFHIDDKLMLDNMGSCIAGI